MPRNFWTKNRKTEKKPKCPSKKKMAPLYFRFNKIKKKKNSHTSLCFYLFSHFLFNLQFISALRLLVAS